MKKEEWNLDFQGYFVEQEIFPEIFCVGEFCEKWLETGGNWPPSPAEAAEPPLCYISLIHERAIMGNERGEGCSLVKVWGVEGIHKIC